MPTTATAKYGGEYGHDHQWNEILAYLGEHYSEVYAHTLAQAVFDAFRAEVDNRLPDGMSWQPGTSEFVYPADRGADLPTGPEMDELFREAWGAVEARWDSIEAAAFQGSVDR